ncbi:Acylphosphatase-2 [Basidiobolus ranarum]|uniref:Acylphosphatase n=1 Tax=Basidiobolus ranarum TaxID=34480 RepID=A0ABR2VKS1_9FUNG
MALKTLTYEVFGRVQGVCFRHYTCSKAKELGLVGYVRNTSSGTVEGVAQGEESQIIKFSQWLKTEGSPSCRIERCNQQFQETDKYDYDTFQQRK